MPIMEEYSLLAEIEREYRRIDTKWLQLHYKTSVWLVLLAFVIECILGIVIYTTGQVALPAFTYAVKYILCPLALNTVFISIDFWVTHSRHIDRNVRVYVISLILVAICFVIYSVHSIFSSLYLIFIIPILLTVVYGNSTLTLSTSVVSIAARIISELFIQWDPDKPDSLKGSISTINFLVSVCILLIFFIVCLIVIRYEREKNEASIQKEIERRELQQKLLTDELTGVGNRAALRKAFQDMEVNTSGTSYIFVMIDLDNFKTVNDTLGHIQGDSCLIEFGGILKTVCAEASPGASAFRFGGDEFCILYKNLTMEAVVAACEKIGKKYEQLSDFARDSAAMTVSFGIARYRSGMTPSDLLSETDSALYRSKSLKNSIYICQDGSEQLMMQQY